MHFIWCRVPSLQTKADQQFLRIPNDVIGLNVTTTVVPKGKSDLVFNYDGTAFRILDAGQSEPGSSTAV